MREVSGVLAPGDFSQGRWACNVYLCDDACDAASQEEDLLIVDAHGWDDPVRGWLMELLDEGIIVVEDWVREQPENNVFLNVCNPEGRRIIPRKKQTVIYPLSIVKSPGSAILHEEKR
jgi:hypothetical protein